MQTHVAPTLQSEVLSLQNLRNAFENMSKASSDIVMSFEPVGIMLSELYSVEQSQRSFSRRYNYRHPSRKVSWRRLNRNQKLQALIENFS